MKTPALLFALAATLQAAPPEPKFRAVTIDDAIQIGYGVAVADVDGDKWPDILLADKKQFVWYRNPGPPKPDATEPAPAPWDKFILAENLTTNDNVCIAAQDIDGDGKCEIAVGAEWNPGDTVSSGAVFYLIPPADRTQKWEPVKFPSVEPTTHRMKWIRCGRDRDGKPRFDLVVVPLHGRGNKNGEGAGVKVIAYQTPTRPHDEWKSEVVCEDMHMTHNFDLSRVQEFPDHESVLLAGKEGFKNIPGGLIGWGTAWFTSKTAVPPNTGGAGEIRWGHFSKATKSHRTFVTTIEPMHGNSLVIYRPAVSEDKSEQQSRVVLTDKLVDGHALACGDLLGVGGDQIVVGWRAMGKPEAKVGVHLWTAFDPEGKDWRDSAVDDGGMACEDLVLADLNGDGKLDIIACGRATHNVKIYFNETPR